MGKDLKGKELGNGLRQNKDGRYEARYIDRFGNRKSLYSRNKVEIKQMLNEALKENMLNKSVKKRLLFSAWYDLWLETYKRPVLRPNSIIYYKSIIEKHILPEIGGMFLDEIKQFHVKKIINKLDNNGYQWETQFKVRTLISDIFNVAIDNDYALNNPAKGVRLSKNKPNDRMILTVEQQEDFFECAAGTFYNNLYLVSVYSGLRPGEMCALRERDIDFKEHMINVNRTLIYQKFEEDKKKTFHIGPPKTYESKRSVPINSVCENALKKQIIVKKILSNKYPSDDEFADLLFVTRFNTPICAQVFNDSIHRIIDEINLQRDSIDLFPEFSAHTFRHTFATRCIEAGIQPKTLQKYLGHSTLEMTMNLYVHVTNDFKQEEMKKLEKAFPEKKNIIPINGVRVG